MSETGQIFTIDLPCKPWIAHYLQVHYGAENDTVGLAKTCLHSLVISHLKRRSKRWERKFSYRDELYCSHVKLIANIDLMQQYGYEIPNTTVVTINKAIGEFIKDMMMVWVASKMDEGRTMADAIRDYQDRFSMPEDVWSYEAIKKHLDRHLERKLKFVA